MELVYITHGNVLHLSYLSAGPSLLAVIGGLYGFVRLVIDVGRAVFRPFRETESRK